MRRRIIMESTGGHGLAFVLGSMSGFLLGLAAVVVAMISPAYFAAMMGLLLAGGAWLVARGLRQ